MKISAVILTKNEEKNIERCLKSVEFCDEIIIVDDFSEDKTIEKIRNSKFETRNKSKILIIKRNLNRDFAAQRNFGMEKSKYGWILFIDADEEGTRELKEEIATLLHNSIKEEYQSYWIKRRDFWWGRELKFGETKKNRQVGLIRLVKKNSGKWIGKVHEVFKSDKPVGRLNSFINHYPHPTVKEFLRKINYYSTVRAKELFEQGKRTNIIEICLYPFAKFLLTYIIKLGFLDGPAGFAYAFFMSFHSFLVRAKLWQFKIEADKRRYIRR